MISGGLVKIMRRKVYITFCRIDSAVLIPQSLRCVQSTKALVNFAQLAPLADGVILARGWLGKLVNPEKMALLQKRMITRCNALGKLCIVARIMDSMVQSPRPTRAEATDVANSVMDGADGFLLGSQTTRGRYPVECVKNTLGICREAEYFFDFDAHFERVMALLREVSSRWVLSSCSACLPVCVR